MTRIKVLKVLLMAAVAVIALRLFQVQILEHEEWSAKAAAQHTNETKIAARRGAIYMMDGSEMVPVVLNNTVYTVIADPMVAKREKVAEVMDELAKDYLVAKWDDVFRDLSRRYYIIAKNVPHSVAVKVREAGLAGVWFKESNARVYPEGQMAAQLLGFVNADGVGQYGIEGAMNKVLAGKDGMMKNVVDVNNVALSIGDENVKVAAEDGEDVVLTIDRNVQTRVEEILTATAGKFGGTTKVSAIVMRPGNGEILAMANVPTYNPANYGYVKDASAYTNYTTEVAFEPASVCKTFAFAAGVDMGVMNAQTTFVNTGHVTVDGFSIGNASDVGRGTITMQYGLNWSLNTSSVHALTLLGGEPGKVNEKGRRNLYEYYYNRFGLGQYTGVEVVEATGVVVPPDAARYGIDLTYANMTFGQGINLTMVQVASAFSAVVNGGVYHTPTVVKGVMGADGELRGYKTAAERNEREGKQVMSERASSEMREMLYNGRSLMRTYKIDPAGYYIGGKSGTAQTIDGDGAYSDPNTGDTIATYIGFGGTAGETPTYVVMVKIWGEGQRYSGTYSARPIFNEISTYLLDYLQVRPKL